MDMWGCAPPPRLPTRPRLATCCNIEGRRLWKNMQASQPWSPISHTAYLHTDAADPCLEVRTIPCRRELRGIAL